MLDRIGGPSFEQLLMRIVETMVPTDGGNPPRSPDEYYFAVRDLFPHVPTESDVVATSLGFRYEDVRAATGKETSQFYRSMNDGLLSSFKQKPPTGKKKGGKRRKERDDNSRPSLNGKIEKEFLFQVAARTSS